MRLVHDHPKHHAGRGVITFVVVRRPVTRNPVVLVHGEVSGFSVSSAFDFRYAMEFVVAHVGRFSSLYVSPRPP